MSTTTLQLGVQSVSNMTYLYMHSFAEYVEYIFISRVPESRVWQDACFSPPGTPALRPQFHDFFKHNMRMVRLAEWHIHMRLTSPCLVFHYRQKLQQLKDEKERKGKRPSSVGSSA